MDKVLKFIVKELIKIYNQAYSYQLYDRSTKNATIKIKVKLGMMFMMRKLFLILIFSAIWLMPSM